MKACVLNAINNIEYNDVKNPTVKQGEVLLKVKASGICSSDLDRVFSSGAYHYPIVLGHEIAGQIIDVADGIDKSYIGKNVVVFPLLPCFECSSCKSKYYAQCSNYNYFGSRCDGGFAEYLSVPFWNIRFLPDDVDFVNAAMCEPTAVALHAVSKAKLTKGKKVLVLGSGLIGIIVGLLAQKQGAEVYFKVRNDKKLEFIKSLGLSNVYKDIPNADIDTCFECVGSNECFIEALQFVKTRGTIILVGNPKSDMQLNKKLYWKILRQEVTIEGVWNSQYPDDWDKVIEILNKLPFEKLITHRFKLVDGINAFKELKNAAFKIKGVFINE